MFSPMWSNCRPSSWSACRVATEREDLLAPLDLLDLEYVHLIVRCSQLPRCSGVLKGLVVLCFRDLLEVLVLLVRMA